MFFFIKLFCNINTYCFFVLFLYKLDDYEIIVIIVNYAIYNLSSKDMMRYRQLEFLTHFKVI